MFYLHVVLLQLLAPATVVTPDEVLAYMHEVPVVEVGSDKPGGWDRIGSAREVAQAISETARSREEAVRMALYAAFEGGNRLTAVGDSGRSLGVFQLQRQPPSVAFSPFRAAKAWLALADTVWCAGNPPGTELAALASGSCSRGRQKVLHRERIIARVLAEVDGLEPVGPEARQDHEQDPAPR